MRGGAGTTAYGVLVINQDVPVTMGEIRLAAGDVEATASGSGDIVVNVNGRLKARLSGSGDLTYKAK